MYIQPILSTQTNQSFKSTRAKFLATKINNLNCFNQAIVKNYTTLFREDIDWQKLSRFILHQFSDKSRVNAFSLACSDGSEAYSYAISIMDLVPETAFSKFFPVYASDINPKVMKYAGEGKINLSTNDMVLIKENTINYNRYFENKSEPIELSSIDLLCYDSYTPSDELRKAVEFKHSDMLTELKKIKDNGNSVVMCRNVFPYLRDEYIEDVLNTAGKVLKKGSLFIIGDFDLRKNIHKKLTNRDFCPLPDNNNVFLKIDKSELNISTFL